MEAREYICTTPLEQEFKSHLRVTSSDLDAELRTKLLSAVDNIEGEISTVIVRSRFTRTCAFAPAISLRYPVTAVASVKVDGVTLAAADYSFTEQQLSFADGVEGSTVEVQYTAGLEQIPFDMKAAIFLIGGSLFNNLTDRPEEKDRTSARNLVRRYRRWENR